MKEILVARKFAAYFAISALRMSIAISGWKVRRNGSVELAHDIECTLRIGADDHAVGLHEVGDRLALLQKLGFETTSKSWSVLLRMIARTSSAVPTERSTCRRRPCIDPCRSRCLRPRNRRG
jgi:hypothetical protein